MMPAVDVSIPTLFLTIIVVSATLACAIATVAWRNSRELLIWSWALGFNALTYVLFALRGQISDLWSGLCCAIQSKGALPLTPDGFIPRAPSRACPAA